MPTTTPNTPAGIAPEKIHTVYADGGVVLKNPSEVGGTWAIAYVSAEGERVYCDSGWVTPDEVGLPWVSNNLTECLALLLAFEGLPDGWGGTVFSDSLNAIRAHRDYDERPDYLPAAIWSRIAQVHTRLGPLTFVLLGGHPNKKELAAGIRKDGKPVSEHNVFCDKAATAAGLLIPRKAGA